MRTSAWIGIVVVVLIVIGGIWYYTSSSASSSYSPNTADNSYVPSNTVATSTVGTTVAATSTSGMSEPMNATVTYNGSSFTPSSVTIMQGGTVNFVDTTSNPFWVASDPHPLHNGYDGTTLQQHCAPGYSGPTPFDECSAGMSFSFTFGKVGSWGYHDHLNESVGGTVVVVAQ